jgi:hypothetical protein
VVATIPRVGPSKSNVVQLLDDRPADRPGVLALDDDRPSRAVDDLLHDDVAPLVGRPLGLADVLVAEVAKDVLHHVLELESREVVQYSHPNVRRQQRPVHKRRVVGCVAATVERYCFSGMTPATGRRTNRGRSRRR